MATMNCIFAAQKNNITIDSCLLKSDSGFLQQASDITGGIYFKVTKMESLLQYLLWMFLPDTSLRESLVLPSAIHIDYRAACFCHRTLVDIGFVCSVCLSIYCQLVPRCHTCQTRFKLPSIAMARPKKKRKEKSNETAIGNVWYSVPSWYLANGVFIFWESVCRSNQLESPKYFILLRLLMLRGLYQKNTSNFYVEGEISFLMNLMYFPKNVFSNIFNIIFKNYWFS